MTTDLIERHPWSEGFQWTMPPMAPRTMSAAQVQQFDELGFVVIDELLDRTTLADVTAEVDALIAEADAAARAGRERSPPDLGAGRHHLRRPAAPEVPGAAETEPTRGDPRDRARPDRTRCERLLGRGRLQEVSQKPRRFPWHQDNGYGFLEPQQYLTFWIALNEAHVNNGCPWIAPGLHRHGTLQHRFVDPLGFECFTDAPSAIPAEVPAGGAAVFSSLTPHLTGPNITGEVRKTYILQYAPAGSHRLEGNPKDGPPTAAVPANDPERQYPVLRGGRPV